MAYTIHRVRKKGPIVFFAETSTNLDNFSPFFGTNHLDNPRDWKIVKNTYTTLRNDDVIVTSLKSDFIEKCRFRKKSQNSFCLYYGLRIRRI